MSTCRLAPASLSIFEAKAVISASVSSLISLLSRLAGKANVAKEKSVALQKTAAFMVAGKMSNKGESEVGLMGSASECGGFRFDTYYLFPTWPISFLRREGTTTLIQGPGIGILVWGEIFIRWILYALTWEAMGRPE
jgi:hypothetical protein